MHPPNCSCNDCLYQMLKKILALLEGDMKKKHKKKIWKWTPPPTT